MSSNRSFNILSSESRTGTVTSPVISNLNNNSGHFIVDISSLSSGQTLSLYVYGVTASGAEYGLFTSLPMNVATTYRSMIGPHINCVAGIACRDFLPNSLKFKIVPSIPAQADTYSIDLELSAT